MKTARIIGTGSYLPKTILTNSDLYKNPKIIENFDIEKAKQSFSRGDVNISKLNDSQIFKKWVMRMTGINQRYIYTDDFDSQPDFIGPVENMGAEAAKRALKASKISPKDLDFIIAATFIQALSAPDPSRSIGHSF